MMALPLVVPKVEKYMCFQVRLGHHCVVLYVLVNRKEIINSLDNTEEIINSLENPDN